MIHLQCIKHDHMTNEHRRDYKDAAHKGTIPDNENPLFIFSLTSTVLLVQLLSGDLNLKKMIEQE